VLAPSSATCVVPPDSAMVTPTPGSSSVTVTVTVPNATLWYDSVVSVEVARWVMTAVRSGMSSKRLSTPVTVIVWGVAQLPPCPPVKVSAAVAPACPVGPRTVATVASGEVAVTVTVPAGAVLSLTV